jgi:zinc transport system permease protein
MLEPFSYSFFTNGLLAGVVIAFIAPIIGIFLILKRYSLIADTLAHVSLAGIALGLLLRINPVFTALGISVVSSALIDRLRTSTKLSGESALALFLSGSLSLAVVLISLGRGVTSRLFNYLFGSIATVTSQDILTVLILSAVVLITVCLLYRQLVFVTFDEDAALVTGLPVKRLNLVFIVLSAITISIAIPIVGTLLISALIVIPALSALQFKKPLLPTIVISQSLAILAVVIGLLLSFYFSLAPGGTIVLTSLALFLLCLSIS